MTGHWEFTYGAERVKEIVDKHFKGSIEFLAQNVNDATGVSQCSSRMSSES